MKAWMATSTLYACYVVRLKLWLISEWSCQSHGSVEKEIIYQITKAKGIWGFMNNVIWNKFINLEMKTTIHKIHRGETSTDLRSRNRNKTRYRNNQKTTQITAMKTLRKIVDKTRRDRIMNVTIETHAK